MVKKGKYGGTYAHKDIAFEFGSAISVPFKLYLIKEFQRLKDDENSRLSLQWDLHRTLSKINYRIHTNLESLNSVLIRQGLSQPERLRKLNDIAISQMRTLLAAGNVKRLK